MSCSSALSGVLPRAPDPHPARRRLRPRGRHPARRLRSAGSDHGHRRRRHRRHLHHGPGDPGRRRVPGPSRHGPSDGRDVVETVFPATPTMSTWSRHRVLVVPRRGSSRPSRRPWSPARTQHPDRLTEHPRERNLLRRRDDGIAGGGVSCRRRSERHEIPGQPAGPALAAQRTTRPCITKSTTPDRARSADHCWA